MKTKNAAKKLISLVLALVMMIGLAMPVLANPNRHDVTVDVRIESGNALVSEELWWLDNPTHTFMEVSNVASTGTGIWTERFGPYSPRHGEVMAEYEFTIIYVTAPATVALLSGRDGTSLGAGISRVESFTTFFGMVRQGAVPVERGAFDITPEMYGRVTYEELFEMYESGWYFPTGTSWTLLEEGYYWVSGGNVDHSGFGIVVLSGDTQPPATETAAPNLNTASAWAHDGINQAFELGLIPQSLKNSYTQATTRAEFTALAVALYETITGRVITGRMQFNDTDDINVQKMGYLGVVTGVGGGNFAPNNTLTREQAAVMLARLADVIGQPLGVGQMQASGIMGGVGDNQFAPQGNYTREQSIVTMLRLFDLLD